MHNQTKISSLFYIFALSMCLNSFFLGNSVAQIGDGSVIATGGSTYTFESIDLPGTEFLALTASSDFGDYAGYTRSTDSDKEVGFTFIDGVFTTYDFPGSQKTHFYALGNDGELLGTTKIAMVFTTVSSWKMANCSNTIFRVPSKRRYTALVTRPEH